MEKLDIIEKWDELNKEGYKLTLYLGNDKVEGYTFETPESITNKIEDYKKDNLLNEAIEMLSVYSRKEIIYIPISILSQNVYALKSNKKEYGAF